MILIVECLYLVLPVVAVGVIVALLIPALRKINFRRRLLLVILLMTCALWVGCFLMLHRQFARYASFDIKIVEHVKTKSDVRKWMGVEPTEVYEPGVGLGGEPIPGSAVWHYCLHVLPFKIDVGLEFMGDRLDGISWPAN